VIAALLLLAQLAWGGCDAPVPVPALTSELALAEQAWTALDAAAFEDHLADALVRLVCVDAVVTPADVGRLHRLQGLRAFAAGDDAAASAAFAAARAAAPDLDLRGLVREGHTLRDLWAAAPRPADAVVLPPGDRVKLWVDGALATERPAARPWLLQVTDRDAVALTEWVASGPPLGTWPIRPGWRPPDATPPRGRGAGRALLGVGVALLGGSAALLGGAVATRADFWEPHPEWDRADLDRAQRTTNGLTVAAAVVGAVGATSIGVGAGTGW